MTRAVALLPDDDDSPERARLLAWEAKATMLRGRYNETVPIARLAIDAATRSGTDTALGVALNALGTALIVSGEIEEGTAHLRRAIEVAPSDMERTSPSVNLADALHRVGR